MQPDSHPLRRWLIASAWTVLLLILLLQSSSDPLLGPAAPPGPPREILLTSGHFIGFAGLTVVWWWAWHTQTRHALHYAILFSILISISTELIQGSIPSRMPSLYDVLLNTLGTGSAALIIRWQQPRLQRILAYTLLIVPLAACNLTTIPPQTAQPPVTDTPVFIDARGTPDAQPPADPPIVTPDTTGELYIPGCIPRTDWPLYTVQDGDIISNMALLSQLSVAELVQANCLANADLLYAGQVLYVPPSFPPTAEPAG